MSSRLRLAGLIEGCTLPVLPGVAVPLTNRAGMPCPVAALAPTVPFGAFLNDPRPRHGRA